MERVTTVERLGETLRRWLAESGEVAGAATLFQGWREIVGTELAAHTHPVEVERGRLIVAADHPGWVQLLRKLGKRPSSGGSAARTHRSA